MQLHQSKYLSLPSRWTLFQLTCEKWTWLNPQPAGRSDWEVPQTWFVRRVLRLHQRNTSELSRWWGDNVFPLSLCLFSRRPQRMGVLVCVWRREGGGDSKLPLCVVVRARPRVLCAYRRRSEHCVDLITAAKTTPTQRRRVINFSGALITLLLLSDCHYQATASCWKSLSSLLQMIKSLLTFKGLIIVLAYCFFFLSISAVHLACE